MLERRRRIDQALYAVVMEAWVNGVSTRNVDALVVALGGTGISKSEVSRICGQLDEEVGRFRTRRLDAVEYPFVFLDATYLHVRTDHLVTSKAVVVATAVAADGRREILGVDVGDREDEVFWHGFLSTRWPKIGPHMDAAKTEVLAFNAFPRAHWRKIWSTNPLERLNKEIKRRARVVGIFLCVPLGTGGSMRGAARLVEVPRMTRNLSVDPHEGLTRLGPVSSAPRGWLRDLIAA